MLPSMSRSAGCAVRLSRRPVAKLSIARTSSPRASSRSMTVEPTRPDPPVTNTFITSVLLSSLGGSRRDIRRLRQHAPILGGTIVKPLVPQFEAQQAPQFARERGRALQIREHRMRVQKRALAGIAAAENVVDQIAQFARKPLFERHRE